MTNSTLISRYSGQGSVSLQVKSLDGSDARNPDPGVFRGLGNLEEKISQRLEGPWPDIYHR